MDDLEKARRFVREVDILAKKFGVNYFVVTDGASGTCNRGNLAVENARHAHIDWELAHGFDPAEEWD